jgi:carbon monoxide dehydrogenase subunit G
VQFRGILAAVLLLTAHAPRAALAAEDLVVDAQRQGESIEIQARAVIAAEPALVWEVLTDYAGLPRFIPGIATSVDQAGEARFLIFTFPIEIRLEVIETPPRSIASRAIGGNLRRMTGRYDIQPDAAQKTSTLRYQGAIEPNFDLPPLVGVAAMRGMVEEQFTAMVSEIERRAAAGGRK